MINSTSTNPSIEFKRIPNIQTHLQLKPETNDKTVRPKPANEAKSNKKPKTKA